MIDFYDKIIAGVDRKVEAFEAIFENTTVNYGAIWKDATVMLRADTDGATQSEGPLNRMFKIGSREMSMRDQYIAEQANQLHMWSI